MKPVIVVITALAAASLLAWGEDAWSGRGGGKGGGARGSHSGHSHPRGHRAVFIGGGLLYASPYSFYFYPPWADPQHPGYVVYVEQFPGIPTADTKDWIYCPGKAASFPEVTECPGGWQRVMLQDANKRGNP